MSNEASVLIGGVGGRPRYEGFLWLELGRLSLFIYAAVLLGSGLIYYHAHSNTGLPSVGGVCCRELGEVSRAGEPAPAKSSRFEIEGNEHLDSSMAGDSGSCGAWL